VALADLNGDGIPDLVTANIGSDNLSVLLANGDGTFQPARSFPGGEWSPWSVAVGDFNGDGRPDVVTANYAGNDVSIWLNDGTWPASPDSGSQSRRPLLGDERGLVSALAAQTAFPAAEPAPRVPAAGASPRASVPPAPSVGSPDQVFAGTATEQPPAALWRAKALARDGRDDWLAADSDPWHCF
jgi:hypothetical protein